MMFRKIPCLVLMGNYLLIFFQDMTVTPSYGAAGSQMKPVIYLLLFRA